MSSAGRAANSNGCVSKPKEHATGLSGFAAQIRRSSLIGSCAMETAEHREPCESRGSRTDLGAPGGEIPPGDSTMIVRVPDWRDEWGPELGPRITGRAVWRVNKITVVDRRLVVGVVVDISPPRRRVGRRCHGLGQRHANYCRRKKSCRNLYPAR